MQCVTDLLSNVNTAATVHEICYSPGCTNYRLYENYERIGYRYPYRNQAREGLIIGYRLQFLISCILINKCRNVFLKGTVHPKMKILSFTPNLYECVCSEHKGRYSEEWGKQSSIFLLLLKSMVPQNSLITNFLQNIFLCVQNKHIHTGLDLLEVK